MLCFRKKCIGLGQKNVLAPCDLANLGIISTSQSQRLHIPFAHPVLFKSNVLQQSIQGLAAVIYGRTVIFDLPGIEIALFGISGNLVPK